MSAGRPWITWVRTSTSGYFSVQPAMAADVMTSCSTSRSFHVSARALRATLLV